MSEAGASDDDGIQCNGITIPNSENKASSLPFPLEEDFPPLASSSLGCESEVDTGSATPGAGSHRQTYLQLPLVLLPTKTRRRHSWFCG